MNDSERHKPAPARGPIEPARGKPTPARAMAAEQAHAATEADLPETSVEVDGQIWTVRVLGRSGGTSTMSPAMLLLGFWEDGGGEAASLESLVVGEALADLSAESVEEAFSMARKPPDPDRRPPFFAEAAQSRRR